MVDYRNVLKDKTENDVIEPIFENFVVYDDVSRGGFSSLLYKICVVKTPPEIFRL